MALDRVVIVNDFSVPHGGASALALLSAKLFRDRGIPVTLFAGDAGQNLDLKEIGVDIVAMGSKPLLEQGKFSAMTTGLYNRAAKDRLDTLISDADTGSTIYHVHVWSLVLSPSIFSALKRVSGRVIVHSHDQFLACPNGIYYDFRKGDDCNRVPLGLSCLTTNCDKRSFVQKTWRVARQKVLAETFDRRMGWGGIVMIHPLMRERLARFGYRDEQLLMIRNPITPFSAERVKAEENSGFLYVGRLEPDKGVLELASAADSAGVSLTLVGSGPLAGQLADKYPKVKQTGWLPPEKIGVLAAKARALVMPSLFAEPFGLVAVEALQSGLPVVLSKSAFLAPEAEALGAAISVDVKNNTDFSEALRTLADMPTQDIRRMSEAAYEHSGGLSTTPDSWCDALLELFENKLAAS